MPTPTSMRLNDELKAQLQDLADRESESVSAVAQRLLEEGVRMAGHPGVVFRSGPAGRRAGLAGGPDVAEVIGFLKGLHAKGEAAERETARSLRLPERLVRVAVDYCAEFTTDIDREIEGREREAAQARERWERQQQLLA